MTQPLERQVKPMDSMPSYEYYSIFNRTSDSVKLKGKFTVRAIENELIRARENCRRLYGRAETAGQRVRLKLAIVQFSRLLEYGFAQRAIYEANINPRGLVAITLKYGKAEVKRRILAQRRANIRFHYSRRPPHRR